MQIDGNVLIKMLPYVGHMPKEQDQSRTSKVSAEDRFAVLSSSSLCSCKIHLHFYLGIINLCPYKPVFLIMLEIISEGGTSG